MEAKKTVKFTIVFIERAQIFKIIKNVPAVFLVNMMTYSSYYLLITRNVIPYFILMTFSYLHKL